MGPRKVASGETAPNYDRSLKEAAAKERRTAAAYAPGGVRRTIGTFTQEDPIGLAGGLNLYGFANGDPINFSDPFGLCPYFLTGKPCGTGAAIGIGFIPVVGDAIEIVGAAFGQDLLTGESLSGVAVGATIVGALVGSGKLARMGAEAVGAGAKRIFSARVLERMAEGPLHNFPQSIGDEVLARGRRTVKSKDYVEYTMPGVVNGKSGMYEIGVRPSASGRTEVITHWFFRPDK